MPEDQSAETDRDPDGTPTPDGEHEVDAGSTAEGTQPPDADVTTDPASQGWWRYPPAALAGLVTAPVGLVVVGLSGTIDGLILSQFVVLVGTALLFVPALALGLGSLLSFGTAYWGSKRYQDDPTVAWNPNPVLYLGAAVLFTPTLVGGVWFVQRVRHVGTPDFSTWI